MNRFALCLCISRRPLRVLRAPGTVHLSGQSPAAAEHTALRLARRLENGLDRREALGAMLVSLDEGSDAGGGRLLEPVRLEYRAEGGRLSQAGRARRTRA